MFDANGNHPVSFINSTSFWNVTPTNNFTEDAIQGHRHAQELERFIAFDGFTPLLGLVVRSMVEQGKWTGIETGFFQEYASNFSPGAGLDL